MFDCGVFTCSYMDAFVKGMTTFEFDQSHMSFLRRRIFWDLMHGTCLTSKLELKD